MICPICGKHVDRPVIKRYDPFEKFEKSVGCPDGKYYYDDNVGYCPHCDGKVRWRKIFEYKDEVLERME